MINTLKTKGRVLVGIISKIEPSSSDGQVKGKVRVRIPEFNGPVNRNDLPPEFSSSVYWTEEENLPWVPVMYPLGTKNPSPGDFFQVNEMVYVIYTDDAYSSPLVIGTTGRLVNSTSSTGDGASVSTGTDGAAPLYNKASPGDTIEIENSGDSAFDLPTESYIYISSPYGPRGGGYHYGTDFAAPLGTNVTPSFDGTVLNTTGTFFTDNSGNINKDPTNGTDSYGNYITLQHVFEGQVFYTRYAHLVSVNVVSGQEVKKGDVIGQVGSTGNSSGPHLHFEIMNGGTIASRSSVNPEEYLSKNHKLVYS